MEDTALTPKHVLLAEILAATLEVLHAVPGTPATRALRAAAERYQRAVADWPHCPPSSLQRSTMFDCVIALRAKASEEVARSVYRRWRLRSESGLGASYERTLTAAIYAESKRQIGDLASAGPEVRAAGEAGMGLSG